MSSHSWKNKIWKIFNKNKIKKIEISSEERDFLQSIFCSQFYSKISGINYSSEESLFLHFLENGLALDFSPTPFFEKNLFQKQETSRQSCAGSDRRKTGRLSHPNISTATFTNSHIPMSQPPIWGHMSIICVLANMNKGSPMPCSIPYGMTR